MCDRHPHGFEIAVGRTFNRVAHNARELARRTIAAVLLAWFGFGAVGWAAAEDTDAAPPNIVFILADDMGWADIGYHNRHVLTPHLDRLAAGGIRLSHHYVSPVCSPTRVGLLTGRYPSRFGVLTPLGDNQVLPHELLTLPRGLHDCGYTTHISGKWHIGTVPAARPLQYGFDTSYGYLRGQIDPNLHVYKNGDHTWHRNDKLLEEPGHVTDLISDEAIRIIRQPHAQPFFLYVAYSVPHYPLAEPDDWISPYYGTIDDPWRRRFAASVSHMDAGVGRIVAALDATGQRASTLLVFASDNGGQKDWNAPKSQYDGRFQPHTTLGSNVPLRGWKGDLYDGGVRVPAFVNWPGHLASGRTEATPISIVDWMPTLLALAGRKADANAGLEGANIWPILTGQGVLRERTFYWRSPRRLAIIHGPWKLITDWDFHHAELFDLGNDPNETQNLVGDNPQQLARLLDILKQESARDPMANASEAPTG